MYFTRPHPLLAIALLIASPCSLAAELLCYVDKRTDAAQCIDPKEVHESAGIRHAPLYKGGPKGARKTAHTVHANCQTKILHLKDRDGVSFAGGSFSSTVASQTLGGLLCDSSVKPGKPPPKK